MDKAKFAKRIEREGIIIVQDPIDNANIFDIAEAYEHFPAKWAAHCISGWKEVYAQGALFQDVLCEIEARPAGEIFRSFSWSGQSVDYSACEV